MKRKILIFGMVAFIMAAFFSLGSTEEREQLIILNARVCFLSHNVPTKVKKDAKAKKIFLDSVE